MHLTHRDHTEKLSPFAYWESPESMRDKELIDRILHSHIRWQGHDPLDHDLSNLHRCQRCPLGCLPSACHGCRKEEEAEKDEPASVGCDGLPQGTGPGSHHQHPADQPKNHTEPYSCE